MPSRSPRKGATPSSPASTWPMKLCRTRPGKRSAPRLPSLLPCSLRCRLQIASARPRIVRARTDNEPDNDRTNTPPTTQIGRLFFLSFAHRPDHPLSRQVHRVVPAVVRAAIAGTRWPDIAWRTTPRPSPNPRRPFDRCHGAAVGPDGELTARVDRDAVEMPPCTHPHSPRSHPILVPVRSRWSRISSASVHRSSTSTVRRSPLTVRVIAVRGAESAGPLWAPSGTRAPGSVVAAVTAAVGLEKRPPGDGFHACIIDDRHGG